jgi:6-pyruvoyltetrahydropterin/6-carboxytetrahydropterin synthase
MWKISKDFAFVYAHRVYVQRLNHEYCAEGDTACACRHLHGHQGKVTIHLEADHLDDRSMIVDFKELGFMKDFVDNYLDHKMIIDRNDPMFKHMVIDLYENNMKKEYSKDSESPVNIRDFTTGNILDLHGLDETLPEYEVLEGYFIVDFVPTSENLAKWFYDIVANKMKPLGVKVSYIEFRETPKSCAVYYGH